MFRFRIVLLGAAVVAGAGVLTLLGIDLDAFEERTGFFDLVGTLIIDAFVALIGLGCALYAASPFFPRSWGERAGPVGAIVAALVAAFCLRVLWLGGA